MMIKLKILVTDLKALNMIKKLFWFYSYIRRQCRFLKPLFNPSSFILPPGEKGYGLKETTLH